MTNYVSGVRSKDAIDCVVRVLLAACLLGLLFTTLVFLVLSFGPRPHGPVEAELTYGSAKATSFAG